MQPDAQAKPMPTGDEGYLVDPSDWSREWALEIARREGIELTDDHWAVIRFVREFYEERHVIPDARFVMKFLADTRSAERNDLFKLFPYGYVKQACKIAGMRKPRAWSTG